jgi:ribosomal protein S18 acetylase RimI-like enzyme
MNIRIANINDLESICTIAEEICAHHNAHAPLIFAPAVGIERDQSHWRQFIEAAESEILVTEAGGEIAGFATVRLTNIQTSFLVPRKICHIGTIVISKKYHRSGFGKALLQAAEEWALRHEASELKLEVFAFNSNAIQLYNKVGFVHQSQIMTKQIGRQC